MTPFLIMHLLLIPWLSWEFRRRYDGRFRILFTLGLIVLPGLQWILAFWLFLSHRSVVGMGIKKRNSGALLVAFSSLMMVGVIILHLFLMSSAYWAEDPNVYGWQVLGVCLALLIPFIFLARAGVRRARGET